MSTTNLNRNLSPYDQKRTAGELERIRALARDRGGECLSNAYVSTKTKMRFRCAAGHEWETIAAVIKRGHWCDRCGGTKRLTIEDMHDLARERGGRCLSQHYVNNRTKIRWECERGHRFLKKPNDVQQGQWCPRCGGNLRHTIGDAQRLARRRRGLCLSASYRSNKDTLLWECARQHRFSSTFNRVQRGNWCRRCAGLEKGTIDEMREMARTQGGECLSRVYVNSQTPLTWRCQQLHVFHAVPQSVKQGHWCSKCYGNAVGTIEEMQAIAQERGGACVSSRYVNSQTPLQWRCGDGHTWDAKPVDIRQGRWCRECGSSLGERLCRTVLVQLFGQPFPKTRPDWLVSPKGGRMELDGYCEALGIAFEHQGLHHYQTVAYHRDRPHDIAETQARDRLKAEVCESRGVALLCIPEVPGKLPAKNLRGFITSELKARGVELPSDFDARPVDLSPAYKSSFSREALEEMKRIAEARGGQCLSDRYVNAYEPLRWLCSQGHEWSSNPVNVKNAGSWCPTCFRGGQMSPYKRRASRHAHPSGDVSG